MTLDQLATRIDGVTQLTLVLVADLADAVSDLDVDRHRRAYVRAAFSLVEGVLFGLKGILAEFADLYGAALSAGESSLLAEESYSLKEDGSVRVGQAFPRLAENVRFTLSLAARVTQTPMSVKFDDQGWAAFKQSIKIRNRLMHPKQASDLTVTDAEMESVNTATAWYKAGTIDLLLKIRAVAIARRGQVE